VLDGARPEYFDVPGIPHLNALLANGTEYTNAWAGLLESETPSGHASLATGMTPRKDGILSFDWADPENTAISLFDPAKIRSGELEKIMRASHAPTIAGLVHAKDPTAKVVALGGHKYYANDALGGPDANVIMYYTGTPDGRFIPTAVPGHEPPAGILTSPGLVIPNKNIPIGVEDNLAMHLAFRTFDRMKPKVMLMNLPEFDWPLGHVLGGNRDMKTATKLMQGFDRDLGLLEAKCRRAGILNQTLFVVTADHGMSPIYHTVPSDLLKKAISAAGTSIITDTSHTAYYSWLKDSSRAPQAALNIARLRNPYIQSVYFRQNGAGGPSYIRASGPGLLKAPNMEAANQFLLHTFNGPNGPDLAVFFKEQAASLPGGEATWKGDHGGNSWEAQHFPLVLSGVGVRKHNVSTYPARLMDIAPTVLTVLGIKPAGMQGTPLADALSSSTQAMKAAQRSQGAKMVPVVTALQRESRLETRS